MTVRSKPWPPGSEIASDYFSRRRSGRESGDPRRVREGRGGRPARYRVFMSSSAPPGPRDLNGRVVEQGRLARLRSRLRPRAGVGPLTLHEQVQVVARSDDDAIASSVALDASSWRAADEVILRHVVEVPPPGGPMRPRWRRSTATSPSTTNAGGRGRRHATTGSWSWSWRGSRCSTRCICRRNGPGWRASVRGTADSHASGPSSSVRRSEHEYADSP